MLERVEKIKFFERAFTGRNPASAESAADKREKHEKDQSRMVQLDQCAAIHLGFDIGISLESHPENT